MRAREREFGSKRREVKCGDEEREREEEEEGGGGEREFGRLSLQA